MIVIYAHPEDEFYPAVVLRTLYVATGLRDVSMYIIPRRRIKLDNIVRYSRVPVELFKEKIHIVQDYITVLSQIRNSDSKILIITSLPDIQFQSSLPICNYDILGTVDSRSLVLIIDELGVLTRSLSEDEELRKRVLCISPRSRYGKLAYDAIAVIYHLFVRRLTVTVEIPEQELGDLDLSELFYLMRHILDSCKVIDNFLIVSPRTLVYTLRHIFLDRGVLVDLVETKLVFDHVNGSCIQEIVIDLYRSRTLEYLGRYTCTLRGRILEVPYLSRSGDVRLLKFYIDYERGRVCFSRDLCYEYVSQEREQELIQEFGTFLQ